ncbi:hypothetical protein BN1013_01993 [Candidatus Rubidus massiliensis]|nr:MAG: hypothetical protein BGO10_06755 [Chlamydia sp. 32-24]CDZ81457.1 hypothetical protein BN1013_01993 [Candidatus Rubidus massiliensis]
MTVIIGPEIRNSFSLKQNLTGEINRLSNDIKFVEKIDLKQKFLWAGKSVGALFLLALSVAFVVGPVLLTFPLPIFGVVAGTLLGLGLLTFSASQLQDRFHELTLFFTNSKKLKEELQKVSLALQKLDNPSGVGCN